MAASKGYNATVKIVNEETGEERELSGLLGFTPHEPAQEFPFEVLQVHGAKGKIESLEVYPALEEVLQEHADRQTINIEGLPPFLEGWRVTKLLSSPDALEDQLPPVAAIAMMRVEGAMLWAVLEPGREQLLEILEGERKEAELMKAAAVRHVQQCDKETCHINNMIHAAQEKLDRIEAEIAKLEEEPVG